MTRWVFLVGGLGLLAGMAGCGASPATPSATQQQRDAVQRAANYCRKKGLTLRVDGLGGSARSGRAASEVDFRCVKAQ